MKHGAIASELQRYFFQCQILTLSGSKPPNFTPRSAMTTLVTIISESYTSLPPSPPGIFANTQHKTHPFCMTQRLVGTASMRSMTFLQVDRCSNEPFSTYCVYCVFYKLILRILRILQIVILEYCVYCVFYKLTSANIAYIAYIAYIALRILRCVALRILQQARCVQVAVYSCRRGIESHS